MVLRAKEAAAVTQQEGLRQMWPLHIARNPGVILVMNSLWASRNAVTLPTVIFSHCLFPIVPIVEIPRPSLHALVRRFEIVRGRRAGCYTGKSPKGAVPA